MGQPGQAQAPGTIRRPDSGRQRPPPVAVDTATSVVPRGDRGSFDIRRKNTDGSQMVITQTRKPDGTRQVTGFRQTEDQRTGTTTRIYADGRRATQTRDADRRTVGAGVDFVTRRDGRREALLPTGKPVFQDRFTMQRERDGRERQVIERTRYARWVSGRPQFDARPTVRYYDVGQIRGAPASFYRPRRDDASYYRPYYSRFAVPVALAATAGAAWVAFGNPTTSYADPASLMGDMQIMSGFEEGYAYAEPTVGTPVYDTPEAAALRAQMASVQQQVGASVQGDAALKQQLGGVDLQASSSQVQQSVGSAVPVQISEEVRQQVRQQVRLTVAMLRNGKPLLLTDILTAGYARIYLFQTAQPLNVASVASGGACFLNTGDLIGFARLPGAQDASAEMKVVASGAASCPAGEVVQVPLTELQEMLNGFSVRVEDNLQKVSACAASGNC